MLLTGEVRSVQGLLAEVEVSGANSLGEHVHATVHVELERAGVG